jgi:hypothetical protein
VKKLIIKLLLKLLGLLADDFSEYSTNMCKEYPVDMDISISDVNLKISKFIFIDLDFTKKRVKKWISKNIIKGI